MDSMWEYNAPQYVDFTKRMDDDRADAYFGMFASMHRIGHIIQLNSTQRACTDAGVNTSMSASI